MAGVTILARPAGRAAAGLAVLAALLALRPAPAAAADSADLALTKEADRQAVRVGENVTFTITLTNNGPDTATAIRFGDSVPDALNFVSLACSAGTAAGTFCAVDGLASGGSVTATLVATPIANYAKSERTVANTAFIAEAGTADPDPGNNQASTTVHILGKPPWAGQ